MQHYAFYPIVIRSGSSRLFYKYIWFYCSGERSQIVMQQDFVKNKKYLRGGLYHLRKHDVNGYFYKGYFQQE